MIGWILFFEFEFESFWYCICEFLIIFMISFIYLKTILVSENVYIEIIKIIF